MSICSNCYESHIRAKHDVGHWWNNPPGHVFVCSDKCYNELEQHVKNGTWMHWRGFPKSKQKPPEEVRAVTDKQFTANL